MHEEASGRSQYHPRERGKRTKAAFTLSKKKTRHVVKLGMNKRASLLSLLASLQSVELLGSVKHNEQGSMQAFLAGRPKGEWYSSLITNPPVSDFLTSNTKALKLHPFHLYQTQYYYSHLPYVAHMLG